MVSPFRVSAFARIFNKYSVFSERPGNIKLPCTWDETRVLQGTLGQYISVARRKGVEWFVGTITNNNARTLQLAFNFLPPGKTFTAKIYSDDPAMDTPTKVKTEQRNVDATTILNIRLPASGGLAVWVY